MPRDREDLPQLTWRWLLRAQIRIRKGEQPANEAAALWWRARWRKWRTMLRLRTSGSTPIPPSAAASRTCTVKIAPRRISSWPPGLCLWLGIAEVCISFLTLMYMCYLSCDWSFMLKGCRLMVLLLWPLHRKLYLKELKRKKRVAWIWTSLFVWLFHKILLLLKPYSDVIFRFLFKLDDVVEW